MKNLFPIILIFIGINGFAQKVEIKIDTLEYQMDEKLEISFEADFIPDSISTISFSEFEIINGPTRNSSMSVTAGITTASYKLTYSLRPIKPGSFKILSPDFYKNGNSHQGKSVVLTIDGAPLTKLEIEKREFELFTEKSLKPEGTTRLVFNDQFGYIEVYKDRQWFF